MRFFILLSLLFLFSSIKPLECDCGKFKPSIKESIERSDLIAIGYFEEDDNDDFVILNIVKSWKGRGWAKTFLVNKNHSVCDYQFKDGKTFLIYGSYSENNRCNVSICSRTKLESEVMKYELDSLDAMIPCIDSSLIQNQACEYDLRRVIGCDGVIYGNRCEARRHGVAVYTDPAFKKR